MIGRSLPLAGPRGHALLAVVLLAGVLLAVALPAAEDDWQTYRDDRIGIEISYPQSYTFSQDAALLRGASEAAGDKLGEDLARRSEFVFFVFLYPVGFVAFNPNLNLSVEQLPEGFEHVTPEDYYWGSAATMAETGVRLEAEDDPTTLVIGEREFYRLDGTISAYGEEIRTRNYVHYDPETRRGFNLSLADLEVDADENFPRLEAVVETVHFVER